MHYEEGGALLKLLGDVERAKIDFTYQADYCPHLHINPNKPFNTAISEVVESTGVIVQKIKYDCGP
jgi:hypothetical protein